MICVAEPYINHVSPCACVLEIIFLVLFVVVARTTLCVGNGSVALESLHITHLRCGKNKFKFG